MKKFSVAAMATAALVVAALSIGFAAGPALAAREVILGAEGIQDRPLDAPAGVGLERDAATRIEAIGCVDEAEHARPHQVVDLDALRDPPGDAQRDPLRERRVGEDALPPQVVSVLCCGRLHGGVFPGCGRSVALPKSNLRAAGGLGAKTLKKSGFSGSCSGFPCACR